MSRVLIGGHAVTEVFTALGPVGSVAPPKLGLVIIDDEFPDRVYSFAKYLGTVTLTAGDIVASDWANGAAVFPQVNRLGSGTSGLDGMFGKALGTPAQNNYGWFQRRGYASDLNTNGTTAIGDALKLVSGQLYVAQDVAVNTEPTYSNHARALIIHGGAATRVAGYLSCMNT